MCQIDHKRTESVKKNNRSGQGLKSTVAIDIRLAEKYNRVLIDLTSNLRASADSIYCRARYWYSLVVCNLKGSNFKLEVSL